MRHLFYYWFAALAYLRGFVGATTCMGRPTCTTGLNGKGEAKDMYLRQGWIPYVYRKPIGGTFKHLSRTFLTD